MKRILFLIFALALLPVSGYSQEARNLNWTQPMYKNCTFSGTVTVTGTLAVTGTFTLNTVVLASYADFGATGVRVGHDGDGLISFTGLGNGSDEDLTLNLDDTANTGVVASSTGLNLLTFNGIGLTSTATITGDAVAATTTLTVPVAAAAAPTVNGTVAYDSTANDLEYGDNAVNRKVANLDEAQTFTNKSLALSGNTVTGASADFVTACSDETGSGLLVFATAPVFTTNFTVANVAGGAPTVSGVMVYDSTAHTLEIGQNGTNRILVNRDEAETLTNKTLDSATNVFVNVARSEQAQKTSEVFGFELAWLRNGTGGGVLTGAADAPTEADHGLTIAPATGIALMFGAAANAGVEAETSSITWHLPPNYVAAGSVVVRVHARCDSADATTATLDVVMFEGNKNGGAGADLVTTAAQSIDTATWASYDFTVTATGLVAGDLLGGGIATSVDDPAGGGTPRAEIGAIEILLTTQD